MKFCSQCGAELPESGGFCPNCGNPIPRPAAEPSPAFEAPVPAYAAPAEPVFPAPAVTFRAGAGSGRQPAGQLKTNRSLLKYILLGIITLGIYDLVVMSTLTTDLNILAHRYDGRRTMHLFPAAFLTAITVGIYGLVWNHKLCDRIHNELERRGIDYKLSTGTFWGWGFFGALILVGPFIYTHKVLKSMNLLCEDYNQNG